MSRPSARTSWWLRCWCAALGLLLGAIPTASDLFKTFRPDGTEPLKSKDCPASCSDVFSKLEWHRKGNGGGGNFQTLHVQERGEPKSGTGLMFETATVAIAHACMYLQRAYGERSCQVDWNFLNRTMVFEPSRASISPGPCPCEDVEMVTIALTNENKHALPVSEDCRYSRPNGIARNETACRPEDGDPAPANYPQLARCVRDSACPIVEDRLQMSVMRDPRPLVVSAYFHLNRTHPEALFDLSLDEYVLKMLPVVCKWVTVRHILFEEILAGASSTFWYDDALESPEDVQRKLFDFIGFRLPDEVVKSAAAVAAGRVQDDRLSWFPIKGVDKHTAGQRHSYRKDLKPETLARMDDALRVWLPSDLLKKFNVA